MNESSETATKDELELLRALLLAPEQKQITKLDERLDDPVMLARDVSDALPQAVRMSDAQGGALANNLTPVVEKVMEKSVRNNPGLMIDILFPIIGSAVRKAVVEMFEKMVQNINQTMENSFSWRSIRWRFEALRAGKPYAEMVLFHTLLFRVEQVFLIRKSSGVLLYHMAVDDTLTTETELVSSMFTAIQDFVADSFQVSQGTPLESLQVGEFQVWVESGPEAILALVIRGNVPVELRETMRTVLSECHRQYISEFQEFDGDTTPFQSADLVLAPCLQSQRKSEKKKAGIGFWLLALVVLIVVGWWVTRQTQFYMMGRDIHQVLEQESGYWVGDVKRDGGVWQLRGLRDPLAKPITEVLAGAAIEADIEDRTRPYYSLEAPFVLLRAQRYLLPPPTVSMQLNQRTLILTGKAEQAWLKRIQSIMIPGVEALDQTGLANQTEQRFQGGLTGIEEQRFFFEPDEVAITDEDRARLKKQAAQIVEILELAETLGQKIEVEVRGFADTSGRMARNLTLSTRRANVVRDLLIQNKVPARVLLPIGRGIGDKGQDDTGQRMVSFKVNLETHHP